MSKRVRRRERARPVPKWLLTNEELDKVAKARCLMILSVLAGELPVSQAILEANISRPTYYQLETRALNAILAAVHPAKSAGPGRPGRKQSPDGRIAELEKKLQVVERQKRRAERMVTLMRKVMQPVPLLPRVRRKSSASRPSTTTGSRPSTSSPATTTSPSDSIPTKDGADAP